MLESATPIMAALPWVSQTDRKSFKSAAVGSAVSRPEQVRRSRSAHIKAIRHKCQDTSSLLRRLADTRNPPILVFDSPAAGIVFLKAAWARQARVG
jgi:hypothetical protein